MQPQSPPAAEKKQTPGRGLVITGMVMMVLAVVVVIVAVVLFGGRLELDGFNRDVAMTGKTQADVPGFLGFRVIESLSSDRDTMTVGVALSSASTTIDCEILTVGGDPVDFRRGSSGDAFLNADIESDWAVAVVAEDLEPGEYSARCQGSGEPSSSSDDQFSVGRVVTVSEVFDFAGPAFGIIAAVVLGGFVGLVGLILLVIGVVVGNRAKRAGAPPGPTMGPPAGPTDSHGGPGFPPGPPPWNGPG